MVDVGFLPVSLFIALYFMADFFRAPRWLQLAIAIPMGLFCVWDLVFGLHIRVPESIGRPLNDVVPFVGLVSIILVLGRDVRDSWRRDARRVP
jgi:hypothetical protein